MRVNKYNDFVLDNQFESIIDNILLLVERRTGYNTFEWDLSKPSDDKSPQFEWDLDIVKQKKGLKEFLSKLTKEKIIKYFYKFLSKVNKMPKKIKNTLILSYSVVFLSFIPFNQLISFSDKEQIKSEISKPNLDIERLIKDNNEVLLKVKALSLKSDFYKAQQVVKEIEKGYSSDRSDRGNYINKGNKKIFIGTNWGISAPVLAEYLRRTPTVNDMKSLSYQTALQIYKKNYWDKQNLSLFNNQSIANLIYDGCVNHGIKAMKDILRVVYKNNGIKISDNENPFNSKFIKMANLLEGNILFNDIKSDRENRYKNSKTFYKHGTGWLKRLNSIKFKEIDIEL
jgi:lysozyme family protein